MDAQKRAAMRSETSYKPTRKRKRIVISCTECHRRKQKCDRATPCSNCVFRNKESACYYETEAAAKKYRSAARHYNASSDDSSRSPIHGDADGFEHDRQDLESAASIMALGYAKEENSNSLGIFKKIENHEDQTLPTVESFCQPDFNGLKERYKSLIRQLPVRHYVDMLVVTFFQEVNWHYTPVDHDYFMDQLHNWYSLSFSVLNQGPQALPADLRFFPALLFQVLALALQFQPPKYDQSLDSLKYVSEMSLDDVANDYSESGLAILSLLGKKDISLAAIQAGFLRTYFFKNAGLVTESWHCLSQTIRDAQEIGWHKDPIDRTPDNPEKAIEVMWLTEFRRRMWLVLIMWDAHMATMLGRPTNMDHSTLYNVTIPIDTPPSKTRKLIPPQPRSETEPPTSLTMLLTNVRLLHSLWDTLALGKDGAHPKDFTKVEESHHRVAKSIEDMPPIFREINPDKTWDEVPGCKWISKGRQILKSTGGFCLMALHKPYAFTNARHRHESLKAALSILEAQRVLFAHVEAQHYKLFNLVISTFDAIVLAAAMYILHPNENRQYLNDALQHFDWAVERFEKMSTRNPMAKSALGVVQAIRVRLMKGLGRQTRKKSSNAAPQPAPPAIPPPAQSLAGSDSNIVSDGLGSMPSVLRTMSDSVSTTSIPTSNTSNVGSSEYSAITDNSCHNVAGIQPSMVAQDSDWSSYQQPLPPGFNPDFVFNGIAPLHPIHDLLFNDLAGISEEVAPAVANPQSYYDSNVPWQFEGDFRDDSFWYIMNQYSL